MESRDDIRITLQEIPVLDRIQQLERDQPDDARTSDGECRSSAHIIPTFERRS